MQGRAGECKVIYSIEAQAQIGEANAAYLWQRSNDALPSGGISAGADGRKGIARRLRRTATVIQRCRRKASTAPGTRAAAQRTMAAAVAKAP